VLRPRYRALHTSDVHLGAFDQGNGERRAEVEAAFARVIDLALEQDVDFLMVAGDLFDNAFVLDETLDFAMREIARLGRPAIVLPGNHDHAGPGSVYERIPPARRPSNLALLECAAGEVLALDGLEVEVWGRAHADEHFSPLRPIPPRGEAPWQLALAHGHLVPAGSASSASYQIHPGELAASDRDYVALGHWDHVTRIPAGPTTVAAYSGTPSPLGHARAAGRVLLVDLQPDGRVTLAAHALDGSRVLPHDEIPLGRYG
jgi:DNA repair protein SbcD/Mre11